MARPTPKLFYPWLYREAALPRIRHMLNPRHMPTGWAVPRIRVYVPYARSYESSEDSNWTKSPHRRAKANGVALRGGDGNASHDHPRLESPVYPDSRLRVDRPPDLSVNHDDPVDGPRWAQTPADCRSEGP